jgi:hypothetical protein
VAAAAGRVVGRMYQVKRGVLRMYDLGRADLVVGGPAAAQKSGGQKSLIGDGK